LPKCIESETFIKIGRGISPYGAEIFYNPQSYDFGAKISYPCTDRSKIWQEKYGAKFYLDLSNLLPLRG